MSLDQEEIEQLKNEEKERKEKSAAKLNDLVIKYKNVFSTEDGMEVLKDLENFCGLNRCSFSGKNEPFETIFSEGMRNVFLYINYKVKKVLNA